ncbi:hypothetical protein EVAR_39998_1 [Eumeta japonica]|uniref:Uncharacterized protein n=1 Tax=Eumeta variegata TaxID=151549 RepID=A0A4C1ZMT0_EUMVA|nr:hypothetical protein EVAR_39998_1 [Eumeta japonica]
MFQKVQAFRPQVWPHEHRIQSLTVILNGHAANPNFVLAFDPRRGNVSDFDPSRAFDSNADLTLGFDSDSVLDFSSGPDSLLSIP